MAGIEGMVVAVTEASSSIGEATARLLCARGAASWSVPGVPTA